MAVEDVADKISSGQMDRLPVLIAIDGFGGSGKSTIARKLKEMLGDAYIIKTDDFSINDNLGQISPDMESYDLERLEEQVLIPLSRGGRVVYQPLDWATKRLGEPIAVPGVRYVIVEGITAYFPSISKYYSYKIWVDTPIDIANKRGKQNDAGTEYEQYWDIWSKNDLAYKQKYRPHERADFIIDNG